MNTHEYFSRPRLFVAISSLMFLTLLLAACGGPTTTGGSVTPTPGKTATPTPTSSAVSTTVPMPPTQTSCPPAGTARAAVMAPLALGRQNTFVYIEGKQQQQPTTYTLKRYTVSTRTTTAILSVPDTQFFGANISADGRWVLLNPFISGQRAIQLVRMDGQGLQTLYCSGDMGWIQWSPDNKYVAFVDVPTDFDKSKWTFKLLTVATGAIQTKPHDSTHVLEFPQAWLDNTHLYVVSGLLPGEGSWKLSLLDLTTGTSKQILNLPDHCIDATHSIDGTQLFTSHAHQCLADWGASGSSSGPSSIQVQSAMGGPAKTIYSTPTDAIKAMRVATNTSLLLLII